MGVRGLRLETGWTVSVSSTVVVVYGMGCLQQGTYYVHEGVIYIYIISRYAW